jgi:hypothetical protein
VGITGLGVEFAFPLLPNAPGPSCTFQDGTCPNSNLGDNFSTTQPTQERITLGDEFTELGTPFQDFMTDTWSMPRSTAPFMHSSSSDSSVPQQTFAIAASQSNWAFNNPYQMPTQMMMQPQVFPSIAQSRIFYLLAAPPIKPRTICSWPLCPATFSRQSDSERH